MQPTRILLADDHAIFREAVRALIEKRADLTVVGEACDGQEALELADRLGPEIVLLELSLPRLSGTEVTRRLMRAGASCRVLVLSAHTGRVHVEEALRAGAAGYVAKLDHSEELLRAIDALRLGRSYLAPTVSQHVVEALTGVGEEDATGVRDLTSREREVLQLIAEGFSSKEIAGDLGLSTRTVETHRAHVMDKLGIHKVSGLVRFAIREGLVSA